ncbi:hypothetical protein [Nostoc sp. ATCC 53789]|uniref:hypothetical protein n=1 Tax=Nostoc sp. ATCC 53789 TaxID=76335 RepID=UPI000DECA153|nr:hypothetical protein [Nostoc sp. ATCC 53789]QHG15661.1 hypothetical protein GJB62_06555 [Nostoc sp. ATCC 53789]RCJ29385.1 hypothetical protein A6V25_16055 [Nostoc sp. ATCC 53789]
MSNATVQASVTATEQYNIPVVEKRLNNIIKAMKNAGVVWDSTINQIDQFMTANPEVKEDWINLTPQDNRKRNIVYVLYIAS